MSIIEFMHGSENITGVMSMPLGTGESFIDPTVFGLYIGGEGEIFVRQGDNLIQIPADHFKDFVKQLKRVNSLAAAEKME